MSFVLLGILNSQAAGAGGAGAYDLLETTVLASSASSVSFTGLGAYSDYKHLQIRATIRTDRGSISDNIRIRLNGVSTNSYANHSLFGEGNSVSSEANSSATGMRDNMIPANSSTSGIFSGHVFDLLDAFDSSKNSTGRILSGLGDATSTRGIALSSGLFDNTAAISSIEYTSITSSNFVAGCRFSLYGIKAA